MSVLTCSSIRCYLYKSACNVYVLVLQKCATTEQILEELLYFLKDNVRLSFHIVNVNKYSLRPILLVLNLRIYGCIYV